MLLQQLPSARGVAASAVGGAVQRLCSVGSLAKTLPSDRRHYSIRSLDPFAQHDQAGASAKGGNPASGPASSATRPDVAAGALLASQLDQLRKLTGFTSQRYGGAPAGQQSAGATPEALGGASEQTSSTHVKVGEPTEQTGLPEGAIGYCEHVVVGHSLNSVYRVVSDVESYSSFLPWCVASEVRSVEKNASGDAVRMDAQIGVGFSLLKQMYRSDTVFSPRDRITARLVGEEKDALLEYLECEWCFKKVSPKKTEVDFEVVFKFRNPIHNQLSSLVLSQVVETMVSSFTKRLAEIHGPPSFPLQVLPIRDPSRHNAEPSSDAPAPSMKLLLQFL